MKRRRTLFVLKHRPVSSLKGTQRQERVYAIDAVTGEVTLAQPMVEVNGQALLDVLAEHTTTPVSSPLDSLDGQAVGVEVEGSVEMRESMFAGAETVNNGGIVDRPLQVY